MSETYELINAPPSRYLCSIPVLAPPPAPNQTATELAKAEEARELSRASAKGWELMSGLEGQCLYFMSGWWSYSFCYGKDIVQFHALPSGTKGGPPTRDPSSLEYVLGRVPYDNYPQENEKQKGQQQGKPDDTPNTPSTIQSPPNTELLVKDNQRYLVQRLDSGTECDLTGRDRTIEIQYRCAPHLSTDRIGWIKEVTTCAYLMVVQTPRLCSDVAFLPPKEVRAHAISCRPVIGTPEEAESYRAARAIAAKEDLINAVTAAASAVVAAQAKGTAEGAVGDGSGTKGGARQQNKAGAKAAQGTPQLYTGATIGGVVVGGRNVLGSGADGQMAARIPPPRRFTSWGGTPGSVVETLAKGSSKAEGGELQILSDEELESLDLNPETIEELRRELQRLAGDKGWKLEVVEVPGANPEIRGIVEAEDGVDVHGVVPADVPETGAGAGTAKGAGEGKPKGRKKADNGESGGEEEGGSEEKFFREEL